MYLCTLSIYIIYFLLLFDFDVFVKYTRANIFTNVDRIINKLLFASNSFYKHYSFCYSSQFLFIQIEILFCPYRTDLRYENEYNERRYYNITETQNVG